MNGVQWLAQRIMAEANAGLNDPAPPRFNPRPPGVIQPDSATSAVLKFLREHPDRYYRRDQIVVATGKTSKAVDWALLFLRAQHHVTAHADESRNPRYLRYAIAKASVVDAKAVPYA